MTVRWQQGILAPEAELGYPCDPAWAKAWVLPHLGRRRLAREGLAMPLPSPGLW